MRQPGREVRVLRIQRRGDSTTYKFTHCLSTQLRRPSELRLERQRHGSHRSRINAWCVGKTAKTLTTTHAVPSALLWWASD